MAKEFLKVVIKSAFIKGYLCFPALAPGPDLYLPALAN